MSKRYKLLVLGGGGFFGLIDATFLSYLGQDYDLCNKIDSISGCSIGGIQACALMGGNTAKEIQKCFLQNGAKIFKRRNKNILDIPWYSDRGLKQSLDLLVGDQTIKDTRERYKNTSMFVPCYNLTQGKIKVYDNIDGTDDDIKLTDISLDTSAAMFYFPIRNHGQDAVVDGGIRQVVPVLTHACGLKKKLGIEFKDMDVFVICAGNSISKKGYKYKQVNDWGAVDWLTDFIIPDITNSNESMSKFWGQNLGFNSFTYYNPVQIYGSLDDISKADYMLQECLMYKEDFIQKWNKFMK